MVNRIMQSYHYENVFYDYRWGEVLRIVGVANLLTKYLFFLMSQQKYLNKSKLLHGCSKIKSTNTRFIRWNSWERL